MLSGAEQPQSGVHFNSYSSISNLGGDLHTSWDHVSIVSGQYLQWFSLIVTALLYLALTIFGILNFYRYIYNNRSHLILFYSLAILATFQRLAKNTISIYKKGAGEQIPCVFSQMIDLGT